jgi:hypothetical protein
MEYKQTMNGYEQTFEFMCDNFFVEYPRLVAEAPSNLGTMYRADDYPELDEVRQKFGFRRAIDPIPESGDFRLDVSATDLEELRISYEKQHTDRLADAMKAPWDRLHTMLVGISEKLTDKEGDDEKKRYFDSLITNPLELCELLGKMNVTNDPKLEEARRQLESAMLCANIESIKESAVVREEVKAKVDAILGKFQW